MDYEDEMDYSNILSEPAERYYSASKGITKSDFLALAAEMGLNLTQITALLPVSRRTVEKVKDKELLSPEVSDRVLQLYALFGHGRVVFGSTDLFTQWLHSPVLALGDKPPYDFINNDTGISMVNDLLGRIEHGVYS